MFCNTCQRTVILVDHLCAPRKEPLVYEAPNLDDDLDESGDES